MILGDGMNRKQQRRTRGATTIEWIVLVGVVVLPFAVATVVVAKQLVPYYSFVEQMNGLPLP